MDNRLKISQHWLMCMSFRLRKLARKGIVYFRCKLSTMCFFLFFFHGYVNIVLITISITVKLIINIIIIIMIRGVARAMNMCTHNARGTDLRSFSETGMEWIFPNSWLPSYGGNPPPPTDARSSADTAGVRGASPEVNLKKTDHKWWHLVVFAVKILIYKLWVCF